MRPRTYRVSRDDLVAYSEASGDHNPIHQDPEVARSVGLPDVIAHGMLTLALAARYVEEEVGQGIIGELSAKFTRPVVVPEEGTEVEIDGEREGERVRLRVTCPGEKVLGSPLAVLRLDDPIGPYDPSAEENPDA